MHNPDSIPNTDNLRPRLLELDRSLQRDAERREEMAAARLAERQPLAPVMDAEAHVVGKPGVKACPDCGGEVRKELARISDWLEVWQFPEHTCPERMARLAREEAAEAERREAWLRNPPPERVAEVRRRTGLDQEAWAPAGLDHLRVEAPYEQLAVRCFAHREQWLAGQRPERGLWVHGPTNHRKTASLAALAFDVAHRTTRRVVAWNFERLLEQYRRKASGGRHRYDAEALEDADLLVLDDIGTQKVTEASWRLLYGLVNDAYGARGQTLYVSSNEDPDALMRMLCTEEHPDGGERIVRRLVQLCDVVEVGR